MKVIGIKRFLKIFIICALLFIPQSYFNAYAGTAQSSFDYKEYSDHTAYRTALRHKMSDVYTRIHGYISDDKTMPIPGLTKTYTILDDKRKKSDNYIPQGLCRAEDYWLITAYDASRDYHSVVYAVDAERRELVSTLTLPNKYHLGGIAFDGSNIWLTGNTSDKYEGSPFVQYIKYDDFLDMIRDSVHKVKKSEISRRVYIKNKPSFLEYDNGKLWVGTYTGSNNSKEGYMYGYKIIRDEDSCKLNTTLYSTITGIDSSVQGVDIYGKYLYVSSSYKGYVASVKTSFVTKYEISPLQKGQVTNLYVEDRELSRIEVPKMNEEILVDERDILINYEAAAKKWVFAVIPTDRILAIRKSLWDL